MASLDHGFEADRHHTSGHLNVLVGGIVLFAACTIGPVLIDALL